MPEDVLMFHIFIMNSSCKCKLFMVFRCNIFGVTTDHCIVLVVSLWAGNQFANSLAIIQLSLFVVILRYQNKH